MKDERHDTNRWKPNGMPFCWQPKAAFRLIEEALELSQAATAKLVYVALTRIASDYQSPHFRVPLTHVATLASLSRRTVERRLPDLERLGLITVGRAKLRSYHVFSLTTLSRGDATPSRNAATHKDPQPVASSIINNCTVQESKETKKQSAAGAVEIPSVLNTPDFLAAWHEWTTYRLTLRKPKAADAMFAEQLKWLAQFPPNTATETLRQSIRNGWQGLFAPKNDANTKTSKPNPRNAGIATDVADHGRRIAETIAKRQGGSTPV